MIYTEILKSETIFDDIYQKMMYISLKSFAFNGKNEVFPGVKKLAAISMMSERKAREVLNELQNKGLIEKRYRVENNEQKTNIYVIKKIPLGTAQYAGGHAYGAGGWVHSMQGVGAQYAPKEKELNNNKLNNTKTMEIGSSNPFVFYEQNGFGSLSSFIAEEIGYWIDNHKFDNSEEMIIEAMKIAIKQNVRKWNYVEGILNQWSAKGIKDINMLRAESNTKQQSKKDTADLIKEALGDEF